MHLPRSSPRSRRPLARAAALLALAAASACSPPQSVAVDVKDYPTDILLKRARAASPGPTPPPSTGAPGFPIAPVPPGPKGPGTVVTLPPPPPPPPPPSCPTASPLVGPRLEAQTRPALPPEAARYAFALSGTFTISGDNARTGSFGPTGYREVHDVGEVVGGGGWQFKVTDDLGMTTSYAVFPQQRAASDNPANVDDASAPVEAGIYVTDFTYRRSDGTTLSLTPQPQVRVAKLPFAAGDRWTSRGIDLDTGITVVVNGQTGLGKDFRPLKDRIDACGTVLDAYWVEYTIDTTPVAPATAEDEPPSSIFGPGLYLEYVGSRVAFAPQYGGIPLEEIVLVRGTDGPDTVDLSRRAVIQVEPREPRSS